MPLNKPDEIAEKAENSPESGPASARQIEVMDPVTGEKSNLQAALDRSNEVMFDLNDELARRVDELERREHEIQRILAELYVALYGALLNFHDEEWEPERADIRPDPGGERANVEFDDLGELNDPAREF